MFVRYFVELPLAAARVEEALLASPPGWLSAMAGAAQARGDELLTAVGVGPLGVVDRVLLHRVAEATLKDFLDRLGATITLSQPGETARMRT